MQYSDKAPTFNGRPDPKVFIDWANEMDYFFDWHKLSDDRKVRFARLKLIGRAKFFWQSIEAQRRQPPITDWFEMIEILSNKYLPHSYQGVRLEAMERKRKLEERKNQFIGVLEQIKIISNELYNDSDDTPSSIVVDETDLSSRKLEELHSELRDLQQDKGDRQKYVLDLLKTVNSLCKVLGIDFKKMVTKIHPSLGNDFEGTKSLTNKTIMGLTSTIQRLREIKMERIQRFKKKTKAAIIIQTNWRCHKAYSYYMRLRKAAIIFQCCWRQKVAWRKFEKLKMDARVPKVERIDLIGVDNFLCVLNNLKIGITWSSCLEEFKFKSHARSLIYSKYLICWHGRIQYLKANSRSSFSQWRRMMRNKIVFIYLLIIVFYNFIVSCCFLLIRILLGVFI